MTVAVRAQWLYLVRHRGQGIALAAGKLYQVVSTFLIPTYPDAVYPDRLDPLCVKMIEYN